MFKLFHKNLSPDDAGGYVSEDQQEFADLAEQIDFNRATGRVGDEPAPPAEPETEEEEEQEEPNTTEQEEEEQDQEEEGEEEEVPEAESETDEDAEVFDIEELGEYDTIDAIKNDLNELRELRDFKKNIEENPPKIQFEDERQEKLFNYAKQFDGNEIQAAQQYLRVQGLPLGDMSAKDILKEKFMMDPRYAKLPSDTKEQYFEAHYEKQYGMMDEDVIAKTEHDLAVQEAKSEFEKLQKEFQEAKTADKADPGTDPDAIAKLRENTKQALNGFDGTLKVSVGENPEGVNVKIDNPKIVEDLVNDISDVGAMWNQLMESSGALDKDGNVDLKAYAQVVAEIKNRNAIYKAVYEQGAQDREIQLRKGTPNADKPAGSRGSVGDGKKKSKSEEEGIASAILEAEGRTW